MNKNTLFIRIIMRTTILIYSVTIAFSQLLLAETSKGQALGKSLNIAFESTSLYAAIQQLQQQSKVEFAFDEELLKLEKVDVDAAIFKSEPIGHILDYLLAGTEVGYEEKARNTVVLYRKQQPGRIIGRITDTQGEPLAGANISIIELNRRYSTDREGNFTISVQPGSYTVEVTYISFGTQRQSNVSVQEGSSTTLNFTLTEEAGALNEVVVTALGVKRESRSLGYAVQEIKGNVMTQARETNLVNGLAGRIAGVNIVNGSNSIGGSSKIVIRGETSLAGSNQPLFVVDGIPINNSISSSSQGQKIDYGNGAGEINPDDIETISVLKGPTAAALYGSRAGNGVVLITTKKGTSSQGIGISFNNTATLEKVMLLPDYQNEYGAGRGGVYNIGDGGRSWGPRLDGRDMAVPVNTEFPPNHGEIVKWVPYPNNVKEFYETGKTVTNNIALSAGNDKGNFRASYTRLDQTGLVPNTDQKRDNIALNTSYNFTNKLTVNASVNYINIDSDNRSVIGYGNESPVYTWIWEGRQVPTDKMRDYWFKGYEGTQPFTYNYSFNDNPYFGAYENLNGFKKARWIGNVSVSYQFTDELSLMARTGIDQSNERRDTRRSVGTNAYRQGMYRLEKNVFQERNSDFLLTYAKELTSNWNLRVSAGGNQMRQIQEDNSTTAGQLNVPGVYNLGNSRIPLVGQQYDSKYAINSLYGMGQVSYMNSLFLDVTARNDWSSSLPVANNSYFYPSVSLSGVFTDFMNLSSDVLSYGKLRLSWARVGNDTRPYRLRNVYGYGTAWSGYQTVSEPASIANAKLLPEMLDTYELGTDLRFFNNRVGIDFTYYNTVSKNQIINLPINQTSGYTSRFLNAGKIQSRGYEVMLDVTPIRSRTFNWDININWSSNRAKVVELVDGIDTYSLPSGRISNQARVGERMGDMYGSVYLRDPDGNIVYINGDAQNDPVQQKLGNYNPDWMAGINNAFSYKGVVASFLIDWKQGGEFYSYMYVRGNEAGQLVESLAGREEGIIADGVRQTPEGTYVPNDVRVSAERHFDGYFNNEAGIFDGTWIKLREVKLGYAIPQKLLGRFPVKDITFSLVARNLALWTKVPHVDPDTSSLEGDAVIPGVENMSLPSARSIGLNLSFKL
ncbi:SusC/RagA family TonB-linked outer membrane protein [Parapedobacter koreensis]|uniref:TonB-linked outer membrane protein, SusC/RagA family n=1 Tax=Parapedobacter koreensis TaxID=332977 RepID=A0A1H7FTD9_9SPHI|nr:SusC/RagA family TonB-linked outer membrane protein [Parapedobacter koreensis]SEK27460.1 TonB-linked outer membrane protein, SusC/RagA family [Parapedobacter koreensis]